MTGLNPELRRQRVAAGMNHRPKPDDLQYANAPRERKKAGRVEVDIAEYKLLRRIAGAVAALYPTFEQTSVPVTKPIEFDRLRTLIQQYLAVRSVGESESETVMGLTDLIRDLG